MKIGIDLDDTFWNFTGPFFSFYNDKFNTSFNPEDLTEYSLEKFFKISSQGLYKLFWEFFSLDLSRNLVPFEGALGFLEENKLSNDFYFITMRNILYKGLTKENLRFYLKEDFPTYFLNNEKNEPIITKKELGRRLGLDLMIDDSFENLEGCSFYDIQGSLFTRPWNKKIILNDGIVRVENWRLFSNFVKILNEN